MDEISAAVQVIIRESQDKGIKSKSRHTAVFSGRDVHPLKYPVSVGGVMGAVSAQIKQDNNDTPFMCHPWQLRMDCGFIECANSCKRQFRCDRNESKIQYI